MTSGPLRQLSPTRLADLLACPLRIKHTLETVDASSAATTTTATGFPHAEMGRVCHAVLEQLAGANSIGDPDAFDEVWDSVITDGTDPGGLATHPELALTKLRLQRAIRRLAALLDHAPGDMVPEQGLSSHDGRLHGRPDLIVRGPNPWIADLKTGRIRPTPEAPVNPDYENQLQLYAYLEHQTTGTWPTHAWLLALQGRDYRIDIHPETAMGLARHALAIMDDFNERYPHVDANPSADHCHWCPHLPYCTEPWRPDTDWQDNVAVLIHVTEIRHGGGDTWLSGDVLSGTVATDALTIRRIDADQHPAAAAVKKDDTVAVVGLRWDDYAESWSLRRGSRLEVLQP